MNFITGSVSFTAEFGEGCFLSMETLVVAQHRNQYYSGVKPQRPAKFGSAPSKHFGDINCRTFHSGAGLLPPPFQTSTTPATKSTTHAPPASHPPKTPPPAAKSHSV
ncbi:hypothetical protein OIU77_019945 [Salix suchowensis]|uniref:Uncharacterized protein n=1 Tax=Salix suchowensis TaxID=1278906 RepID=A0ABQ9CIT3_9ROSI|nr:hypothetical protein OIU77_019945 [Salix suchowensis]